MHIQSLNNKTSSLIITLPLVFLLAGCAGVFSSFEEKPRPQKVKSVQTEKYIENLAMAQLSISQNPENISQAEQYIKSLNGFASGKKPARKNLGQEILSFEYTLKGQSEKNYLIIPISTSTNSEKFASLRRITQKFSAYPHTLHDIRAYYVTVELPLAVRFSKDDASSLEKEITSEQQQILASKQELPPLENARLQLQLVKLFMQNNLRDAAYIAIENVKEFLAFLAENSPGEDISFLSKEADELEVSLHKQMPYKL